jgi:dTDP-4-dehydrorhamnose 3,5-epimerase
LRIIKHAMLEIPGAESHRLTIHQSGLAAAIKPSSQVPLLLGTKRHADSRGWFSELYNEKALTELGVACRFVQDNQSMSARRGTIRGLHCQLPPMAQAKLVRVQRGRIFDVAVDVRYGSPTYGRFVSAELSADNGFQLYVPTGFAHGFCTLEDATEVSYKVSEFYSPRHNAGIRWDDPQIAIPWPVPRHQAIVSSTDATQPPFHQWQSVFPYAGAPLAALVLLA